MRWTDFHQNGRAGPRRVSRWVSVCAAILLMGTAQTVWAQSTRDSTRVQVRLHHETNIESLRLTPVDGDLSVMLPSGGAPVLRLEHGDTVTLGRRESDVYVRRGEGGLYARSVFLAPTNDASWTLNVNAESTRTYSGALALSPENITGGVQLVNRVPLDDYVASVVGGEYGLGDREGAKAMAVVARTYALFSNKHFDGDYDHVDDTASQVYRGLDEIAEADRRAARTTRGEVLTYDGRPIQAVYYSSSGGHTANNENVWHESDPLPYLRGKEDPYDADSPHHRWSVRVDRSALLQVLSVHQGASVNGFLLGDRTSSGRLATIKLLHSEGPNTEVDAETFRAVVNEKMSGHPLKSTWFDARRDGSEYVFEGRGYGHGVGLNQWGAHAMAERGKTYRDILRFYYPGAQITHLDELRSVPKPPSLAEGERVPAPDSLVVDTTERRVGW